MSDAKDISDDNIQPKRLKQLLAEQKRLLKPIVTGHTLDKCLSLLCRAISRLGSGVRACVLLVDDTSPKVPKYIAPELEALFAEAFKNMSIDDLSGTFAEPLFKGEKVISEDIKNDQRWSGPWRELCIKYHVMACYSLPVTGSGQHPKASFTLCFEERREPNEWERQLAIFGINIMRTAFESETVRGELRKKEERLRAVLEGGDLGAWDMNMDERMVWRNLEHDQIFGYDSLLPEWSYDTFLEHVLPEDRERVDRKLKNAETGNGIWDFECRIRRVDGNIRWIWVCGQIVHRDDNMPKRMIGTIKDITKRKKQEEALRRSEERFRAFVTESSDSIYIMNPDWTQMRELKGRDFVDEQINPASIRVDEYVPSSDQQRVWKAIKEAIETKSIFELEHRVRRFDGTLGWTHSRAVPILDDDDEIIEWFGVARDVTQRREAEERLNNREEKYRTLFESMDEGYCIIKMLFDENDIPVNYRYLEANPAFEEQSGLKNVVGKTVRELIPQLKNDKFEIFGKVSLTGEPIRFESFSKELNRWLNLYAFRMGAPQERKVAILFNDITQRKQIHKEREQLLRAVEAERERLNEIFQQAPSLMCVLQGPDHKFERANKLYKQVIGNREIAGKTAREVFPDLEGQAFFNLLDQVYETGEPYIGKDVKVVLQLPNSEQEADVRYLNFVYQPLRDPDGTITGIFAQGVDLTERKEAEEQLRSINETLEERVEERTSALLAYQDQLRLLVGKLSKAEEKERQHLATELHDNLGQLLAIAKIDVDLLKRNELPSQIAPHVANIGKLVNDAIIYTRELMSDLKPPPSLYNEDLKTNISWVAKKMKQYDLDVTIKDDGMAKPLSEEVRTTLMQCVRESLINVVKHAGTKEALVNISRLDNKVQIIIEDQGKGFDPEILKQVSAADEGGNFGLFNIAERMNLLGGSLEVESEVGKGTKIILLASLKEKVEKQGIADQVNQTEQPHQPHQTPGAKVKVLLADDQEMIRKGLRKIIEEEGDLIVIGEAKDGEEAIQSAREVSPDVIVMDVNMPRMNGIEATEKIKSSMPNVQIIGLSLYDNEQVIRDMQSAGASAYITKDEAIETLSATIRSEAAAIKK